MAFLETSLSIHSRSRYDLDSHKQSLKSLNNHSHNTRSSQSSLVIPHHGTYGKSAFCITGAKLWNSLILLFLVNFKKKVKAFLYDKMVSVEQNEFILY